MEYKMYKKAYKELGLDLTVDLKVPFYQTKGKSCPKVYGMEQKAVKILDKLKHE